MKYTKIIGVDTGVNTGFAVWDAINKKFISIETLPIHKAILKIIDLRHENIFVRVEDARQRKWFGNAGKEVLQGVGSVKRDAIIWEEFLNDYQIAFEMIHPIKGGTKLNSETFKSITKWTGRTTSHSRDAALMVFQFTKPNPF